MKNSALVGRGTVGRLFLVSWNYTWPGGRHIYGRNQIYWEGPVDALTPDHWEKVLKSTNQLPTVPTITGVFELDAPTEVPRIEEPAAPEEPEPAPFVPRFLGDTREMQDEGYVPKSLRS